MRKQLSSLLISLGIHLIIMLISGFYIVQQVALDEEVFYTILTRVSTPKIRRRSLPHKRRAMSTLKVSVQTPTPKLQQVTTNVRLPISDSPHSIPAENTTTLNTSLIPDDSIGSGLPTKRALKIHRGDSVVTSQKLRIMPDRSQSSILENLDTSLPEAELAFEDPKEHIFRQEDVTQKPRFIKRIIPQYPELARRAQKEGRVLLEAVIGTDGVPTEIRIIQAIGFGCDEAAVKALKASRFRPAELEKQRVVVRITIPYNFKFSQ